MNEAKKDTIAFMIIFFLVCAMIAIVVIVGSII